MTSISRPPSATIFLSRLFSWVELPEPLHIGGLQAPEPLSPDVDRVLGDPVLLRRPPGARRVAATSVSQSLRDLVPSLPRNRRGAARRLAGSFSIPCRPPLAAQVGTGATICLGICHPLSHRRVHAAVADGNGRKGRRHSIGAAIGAGCVRPEPQRAPRKEAVCISSPERS
jgi:hypothetical protein